MISMEHKEEKFMTYDFHGTQGRKVQDKCFFAPVEFPQRKMGDGSSKCWHSKMHNKGMMGHK